MDFLFGPNKEMKNVALLLKNLLDRDETAIKSNSWGKEKQTKLQIYNYVCRLMKRLNEIDSDQEQLQNLRDFALELTYRKTQNEKILEENTYLIELQKYFQQKVQRMKDQKIVNLQTKIEALKKIFLADKVDLSKYSQIIGDKAIQRVATNIHEKVQKYDEIMTVMSEFGHIEKNKKFKKMFQKEDFSKKQWEIIERFSEKISKPEKTIESKKNEGLSLFIKEIKRNQTQFSTALQNILQNDIEGNYSFLLKKIKELKRLKQVLFEINNHEFQHLQYETQITVDTKKNLEAIISEKIRYKEFQKLQKKLYGIKGFQHHFNYLKQVNEKLSKLEKHYNITSLTERENHPYYNFYLKITSIISYFERKHHKNDGFNANSQKFTNQIKQMLELQSWAEYKDITLEIKRLKSLQNSLIKLKKEINPHFNAEETKVSRYSDYVHNLHSKISSLERQAKDQGQLSQKQAQLNQQILKLREDLDQMKTKKAIASEENKRLRKKQTTLNEEISQYEKILNQRKRKNSQAREQIQILQEQKRTLEIKLKQVESQKGKGHKFCGKILSMQSEQKIQELLINLVPVADGNFKKSSLVYSLDMKNPVNFHEYIDDKQNLLIIVQLENGMIVGGYGHGQFDKTYKGSGILFNLTKSLYYSLLQKNINKAFLYDNYHIIVGNSEIRIRFGSKTIMSNFGIVNRYYDTKKATLNEFIGSEEREVEMRSFEVYELIFE